MAYFITNDDSTKGKDPNINIINGLHDIKGKTSVKVLVSNYTKQTCYIQQKGKSTFLNSQKI